MILSIVIPVYNEKETIRKVIDIVQSVEIGEIKKELVIIDDCSKDGTKNILESIKSKYKNINLLYHDVNRGKGAALQTGFNNIKGDIVIIQDADLEYNPKDIKNSPGE